MHDRKQELEKKIRNIVQQKTEYETIRSYVIPTIGDIKEIAYRGTEYEGKYTKNFAYYGIPQNQKGQLPAVLLLHGGGGHAFLDWVTDWMKQGYIAMAIDTEGQFPQETEKDGNVWGRNIPEAVKTKDEISGPQNDYMSNSEKAVENQWIFHASVLSLLALNIFRHDEHVDKAKIGICGISWGAVLTSIVLGYDKTICFGISIYGNAYLSKGVGIVECMFQDNEKKRLWFAEDNFDRIYCPILWIGGDEDHCFSPMPKTLSYFQSVKRNPESRIIYKHCMEHSHETGKKIMEVFRFANAFVGKDDKLPQIYMEISGSYVSARIMINSIQEKVKSAKIYYLTKSTDYEEFDKYHTGRKQYCFRGNWSEFICTVRKNEVIKEKLPEDALCFYLQVVTEKNNTDYISSSPLYCLKG